MTGDEGENERIVGDSLTRRIIEAVIRVHRVLGPGFVESIYRRALLSELRRHALSAETEVVVDIYYEGQPVGQHRIDILVERRVIVELKAVAALLSAHYSQVRSYLRATGLKVALLVNFASEKADFRRIEVSSPHPQASP